MQSADSNDYIELSWSYASSNINQVLELPLASSNLEISKVSVVSIYVTTTPVSVGTHTAYIVHWNQADKVLATRDGNVVLSDHLLYLPIIWTTYYEAHTEQSHSIDQTTASIRFWVTYEDDSQIVLSGADARFVLTLTMKTSVAGSNSSAA